MSKGSIEMGDTGPKFCWHCNRKLHHVPGFPGYVYFTMVIGPGGEVQRVHGACKAEALADGSKPHVIDAELKRGYKP